MNLQLISWNVSRMLEENTTVGIFLLVQVKEITKRITVKGSKVTGKKFKQWMIMF